MPTAQHQLISKAVALVEELNIVDVVDFCYPHWKAFLDGDETALCRSCELVARMTVGLEDPHNGTIALNAGELLRFTINIHPDSYKSWLD